MDRRPLPEEVARTTRAYLAALVPGGETSDAWHELLEDATYWGETTLVPVLHLAHQVVLQHERVTPDVATLALVEVGIDDPANVATILDVDADTAQQLVARVVEPGDDPDAAHPGPTDAQPPARGDEPPVRVAEPPATGDGASPTPDAATTREPAPTSTAVAATGTGAVRIGFDEEDGPEHPAGAEAAGSWFTTRRLLVIAIVLWTIILVVWALRGG